MKLVLLCALTLAFAVTTAHAKIKTMPVEYKQGGAVLEGYLAYDDAATGKRPGVLVVHEWWGHNQHTRDQATRLAEAGYVALAVDMYGSGKVTSHPDSAQAFMMAAVADPATVMARFNAALEQLKQDPHVDPDRIAAIGYCFGGSVVLSMARGGADLDAVASFHGGLGGLPPVDSGHVRARILVLTGAADPMVPPALVDSFRNEMQRAGARVQIVSYPNAKHGFTNPAAGSFGMEALGYDANADRESWAAMLALFRETFGR